jgi:hypothetical protein
MIPGFGVEVIADGARVDTGRYSFLNADKGVE